MIELRRRRRVRLGAHRRGSARLSLAVERGEWVALIGPNGAGQDDACCARSPAWSRYDGDDPCSTDDRLARRSAGGELARRVALVPQAPADAAAS